MKKDIVIAAVVAVVVVAIVWGLAAMRPDFAPSPAKPFVPGEKPSETGSDKVIMRVNGEPITETDFNAFIQEVPPEQRQMYTTPKGRRLLADELVKLKTLEQEGKKMGLEKDPEVQGQIDVTTAQIIAAKALQKIVGAPDDAALKAEYEKERKNFETVNLGHVLVAYQGGAVPPKNGQPLSAEQAMAKAGAIAQRLRQGAVFEQVARAESDDTSTAQQGGSLGEVPIGMLPPDVGPAVAAMKAGEISNPVRSQYGIHVFRAGQRGTKPFEELKPVLEQRAKQAKLDETLKRLTGSAKVDLDPRFFPEVKEAEPPAAPKQGQ